MSDPELQLTPDDLRGGIHKRLEYMATVAGNQPALHFNDAIVSYAQLEADANRLAGQIQAESDSPFVATQLTDEVMTVVAAFAIFKLGRTWIPVADSLPPAATASYLQQYDDALLLTDMADAPPYARVLRVSAEWMAALPDAPPISETVDGDDICLMLSTSGSTGTPKAIPWPHDKLANNLATRISFAQSDPQLMSFWGMIYAANITTLFATLCHGGTFHRMELRRFPLHDLHRRIKQAGIHIVACVPSSFRVLFARVSPGDFPALTEIRLGGETMLASDLDLFKQNFARSVSITNSMGSTEAGSIGIFPATHDTVVTTASVPVGKIGGEREVYVVNSDGDRVVAEEGEIRVSAPDLTPYWNDPQESARKFFPDPVRPGWTIFHTGDLGMMLEDGNLVHLGRMDLQVKIRGQRVEIAAIENRLLQHPAIEIAVVNPVGADENLQLAAYYTLDPQVEPPDAAALRVFLAEVLPDYMLPSYLVPMQQLPTLPTGKVDRQALPTPDYSLTRRDRPIIAPQTRVERRLLAIWRDILDSPGDISTDDSFFDLGGSSLQATALISDVNELFNVVLTPATLYQHPTIAGLARLIETGAADGGLHTAIIPFRNEGDQPPLFCVPGGLGNGFQFKHLAELMGKGYPVYGLQMPGLGDNTELPDSLDALVTYYSEAILSMGMRGPIVLLGASVGGIHALEVARNLSQQDVTIQAVIMLDTPMPMLAESGKRKYMLDVDDGFDEISEVIEKRRARVTQKPPSRRASPGAFNKRRERKGRPGGVRRLYYRARGKVRAMMGRAPAQPAWQKKRTGSSGWKQRESQDLVALHEKVRQARHEMLDNYTPAKYEGAVVYFSATRTWNTDKHVLWEERITGAFTKIDLDSEHTMTNYPYVVDLADELKRILR